MTTTSTQQTFTGPFKEQLAQLAELVEWLESEHGKSFVKAGDDKVYAYGGNGYILVFDESKWDGVVEFMTPETSLTIKRSEGGQMAVTAEDDRDEKAIKELIENGTEGLKGYYENRYWSTP